RDQTFHERRNRLDRLHPIVYEEHLTAARQFQIDRRLDHTLGKLDHLGLNRESIAWRRFDQRHVAHAAERHVERTRNRRRRKRQHVDFLLEMFETFFVRDSETLFFVDNNKTEILERDVFRKDAMRT